MTKYGFLKIQIFVTSVPGWRHVPIWEMGVSMPLYGSLLPSLGFGVHKMSLTLLLITI